MIFRSFGCAGPDVGVQFFCDDLPAAEADAILNYLRASREVKMVASRERPAYQHYASVQFGAFYMQQEAEQNAN